MPSSTWEVVTERQDDRRALAEPQGVMEPIRALTQLGMRLDGREKWRAVAVPERKGRKLQENLLQLRSIYPVERSGCRRAPYSTATPRSETPPPPSRLASRQSPELKPRQPHAEEVPRPEEAWSLQAPPRASKDAWLRPTGHGPLSALFRSS